MNDDMDDVVINDSSVSATSLTNFAAVQDSDTNVLVDNIEIEIGDDDPQPKDMSQTTKDRAQWDNKFQFILTLIGFAVGLGNVWRFSYYVKKNGGGVFLIPYFIMLFLVGIPLFFLELTLGQKMQRGAYKSWFKICPALSGIGISSAITATYINVYYNVIISWVLFYFVNSFHAVLPWEMCCGHKVNHINAMNVSELLKNNGSCSQVPTDQAIDSCTNDFTQYFWYNRVLRASDDIGTAGEYNWRILLCLLSAWIITYLCVFRGIKSSGKVAYVTAIFPYLVLTVLFVRGVSLEGSGIGVEFLFKPDWSKLYLPQVWLEAATQIFFSLGIGIGGIIALSSYSTSNKTALRDSITVCLINSFTSIFSSITIFAILGFKAHQTGRSVGDIPGGPGLAFEVFTETVTLLPGSPFWAVLFFVMLLTLGVDSMFTSLEGVLTILFDIKRLAKIRKELLVGIVCIVLFLVSQPFVLGCGGYLFQLFDQFSGTLPLLLIAIFEYIAVAWVYGTHRFLEGVTTRPAMKTLWWIMWTFVGPILMIVVFIGSLVTSFTKPLEYDVFKNYEVQSVPYPGWARFIGAVLVISALSPIPVILIARLVFKEDDRNEAKKWFTTLPDKCVATWEDFKQHRIWSSVKGAIHHRSWSPLHIGEKPPYVDVDNSEQQ